MSQPTTVSRGVRWAVACLALMVVAAVVYPAKVRVRYPDPRKPRCLHNLKIIGSAFAMYCQDYDDRMPPARGWHGPSGHLAPYVRNASFWVCPKGPRGETHYGYNDTRDGVAGRTGREMAEPAMTITCLDYDAVCVGLWPPSRIELVQPGSRHTDGVNCLFQDGHVMWLAAGKAAERRHWTRQADGPSAHLAP